MTANRVSAAVELILAVDAGGTKTAAWLAQVGDASPAQRVLGRGVATSGNPLSAGLDDATRAISIAAEQARHEANLPAASISRAVLSIAGAAGDKVRNQVSQWAHKVCLAAHVAIVPDVLPVLAAGTPDCRGIAVISGTGSVAYGRAADGRTTLAGGWGFLLGDDGSGYAIGRAGLRYALEELETNADRQPLTRTLLDELGVVSIAELKASVYQSPDLRAKIASLAPRVTRAAEEGYAAAISIVDAAARDLANMVSRAARSLDLADGRFALALGGGVLVGSKRLQDQLVIQLHDQRLDCDLRVVAEPLEGCLRLADPQFAGNLVQWE